MTQVVIICQHFSVACKNAREEKGTLNFGYTHTLYFYCTQFHILNYLFSPSTCPQPQAWFETKMAQDNLRQC